MSSFESAQSRQSVLARLRSRGASRWYAGTIFGLAYQVIEIVNVWTSGRPLAMEIVGTALLGVFYAAYVVLPPLLWMYRWQTRLVVITAYWLVSFALWPFIGLAVLWVWPLVGAVLAFCWLPLAPSFLLSGAIVAVQVIAAWASGWANEIVFAPFVTVTVLISLFGITRQIMANRQLQDAQATIASLAVDEERARMARDLHDILGHSLTVVIVKAELATRLVELDPARAQAEIREVETLARNALVDLRATVSSSREVNLATELASARTALAAANIEAHVPLDADTVDPDLRALFGWVVREAVTNVIRHSRARACWIDLGPESVSIRDDGVGDGVGTGAGAGAGSGAGAHHGNGLRGLAERASALDLDLTAAPLARGGYEVSVARQRRGALRHQEVPA